MGLPTMPRGRQQFEGDAPAVLARVGCPPGRRRRRRGAGAFDQALRGLHQTSRAGPPSPAGHRRRRADGRPGDRLAHAALVLADARWCGGNDAARRRGRRLATSRSAPRHPGRLRGCAGGAGPGEAPAIWSPSALLPGWAATTARLFATSPCGPGARPRGALEDLGQALAAPRPDTAAGRGCSGAAVAVLDPVVGWHGPCGPSRSAGHGLLRYEVLPGVAGTWCPWSGDEPSSGCAAASPGSRPMASAGPPGGALLWATPPRRGGRPRRGPPRTPDGARAFGTRTDARRWASRGVGQRADAADARRAGWAPVSSAPPGPLPRLGRAGATLRREVSRRWPLAPRALPGPGHPRPAGPGARSSADVADALSRSAPGRGGAANALLERPAGRRQASGGTISRAGSRGGGPMIKTMRALAAGSRWLWRGTTRGQRRDGRRRRRAARCSAPCVAATAPLQGVSGTAPSMIERVPASPSRSPSHPLCLGGMPPISASQRAEDIAAFVAVSWAPEPGSPPARTAPGGRARRSGARAGRSRLGTSYGRASRRSSRGDAEARGRPAALRGGPARATRPGCGAARTPQQHAAEDDALDEEGEDAHPP